jgi:hypothetical protein
MSGGTDPRVLRSDPLTGVTTWFRFNEDGTYESWKTQDVSGVLDANKQFAPVKGTGRLLGNTQKHLQKIAEIPLAVYNGFKNIYGEPRNNPKAWARILNDPANRDLRTGGGHISPLDMRGR